MHDITIISRPWRTRPRRLACVLVALAAIGMAGLGFSAGPVLADSCPNEQLRAENNSTGLPECRAYELVTNPFKEGFAPFPIAYTDEGALTYRSVGNFAGDGLGSVLNQYVATRSATGWASTDPGPSGPTYGDANEFAAAMSPDLRSSLWLMRLSDRPTNEDEYYVRRPDGSFTLVGPGANPATLALESPGSTHTGPLVSSAGASTNLSHFLFTIEGQHTYPGIVPGQSQNLYEYVGTGHERPEYVAVDNAGNQLAPGQESCPNGISTDGRVVFFTPGCNGSGTPQVWARVNETTSIRASASQCTRTSGDPGGVCNAPAEADFAGAASDGSRVFFITTQQLVNGDTDETNDLYACDIPPGTLAPVGTANPCASLTQVSHGAADANVENVVRVSADGSRVYFVTQGVLAGNPGANDLPAVAGANNLYVSQIDAAHPAGQITFIGTLQSDDASARTTADGRYLVFTTSSKLVASDTDEAQDVYRYDADTRALLRLSTDTSGTGGNEPGFDATLSGTGTVMTSDAGTIVFTTSEALSPADTNGTVDVYAWHEGQVSLISSGRPSLANFLTPIAWITPSGGDIYFETTAQLTPDDGDTNPDIYDARIDGGFRFPELQHCSDEACQGALTPQPSGFAASGTGVLNGPGNPAPPTSAPVKPAAKPLTRAQKLARALKACGSKHDKRKRSACEKRARATYRRAK